MTIRIQCISIDADDQSAQAKWWADALGWTVTFEDEEEAAVEPPADQNNIVPDLLFIKVPHGKSHKNRLHFDLRPDDQATEIARFEALGATRVDVGQSADSSWVVMADPESNEFCILRALTPEELAE